MTTSSGLTFPILNAPFTAVSIGFAVSVTSMPFFRLYSFTLATEPNI